MLGSNLWPWGQSMKAWIIPLSGLLLAQLPSQPSHAQTEPACIGRSSGHEESIAACDKAIASRTHSGADLARLHYHRATARHLLGSREERHGEVGAFKKAVAKALPDMDHAVRLDPRNTNYLSTRCRLRSVVGEFKGALADCNQVLEMQPSEPHAEYRTRGEVYSRMGDWDKAIADYTKSISLHDKYHPAYIQRGCAKKAKGDVAEGEKDTAKARELIASVGGSLPAGALAVMMACVK